MTFNLTKDQIEIQARAREIASTLVAQNAVEVDKSCLLYTSPSPRD